MRFSRMKWLLIVILLGFSTICFAEEKIEVKAKSAPTKKTKFEIFSNFGQLSKGNMAIHFGLRMKNSKHLSSRVGIALISDYWVYPLIEGLANIYPYVYDKTFKFKPYIVTGGRIFITYKEALLNAPSIAIGAGVEMGFDYFKVYSEIIDSIPLVLLGIAFNWHILNVTSGVEIGVVTRVSLYFEHTYVHVYKIIDLDDVHYLGGGVRFRF